MKVQAGDYTAPDQGRADSAAAPIDESAVTGVDPMEATQRRLADLEESRKAAIRRAFTRIDPMALGAGVGVTCGLGLAAATVILIFRGGSSVGATLAKLGHYFPGYDVNGPGIGLGLLYGAVVGFGLGVLTAVFRNYALRVVLWRARWQADSWRRRHMLDEI